MVKCGPVNEHEKTQLIRLADVFAIGPLMIYAGVKAEELPKSVRAALIATGIATVGYNGQNYLDNERDEQRAVDGKRAATPDDDEG